MSNDVQCYTVDTAEKKKIRRKDVLSDKSFNFLITEELRKRALTHGMMAWYIHCGSKLVAIPSSKMTRRQYRSKVTYTATS